MIDSELSTLCAPIIAIGFAARNDPMGKFRFDWDDISIVYRGFAWIISDPEHGEADYASLRDLIEKEFFRWNDE